VHAVLISTTLPIIKVSHEIFIHTPPSFIDGNILYRLLSRSPKRAEKHTLRSAEPRVAPPPPRLASGWLASLAPQISLKNDTRRSGEDEAERFPPEQDEPHLRRVDRK
jgi:hypothetical protein